MSTILKTSDAGRKPWVPARGASGGRIWPALLAAALVWCAAAVRADETGLVVKVYACPTGQAAATAEKLRTEFGAIAGVRIAADERTAKVIAQAPPQVQARISQRLATLTPNTASQPPGASSQAGGATPSRNISLHRVTAEQVEASLWSMLGSRLSALPSSRPQARRYRLALAGGGSVDLTLDFAAASVNVEGFGAALDASARLIQVLDSPSQTGDRNVRVLPLHTASASVDRVAAAIRNTTGPQPKTPPALAMLFQPRDERPESPPVGAATAAPPAPKPAQEPAAGKPAAGKNPGGLINPVQIELLDGLDVLVLRGGTQDVDQVMDIIRQVEKLSAETEPAIEILPLHHVDCQSMGTLARSLYDEVFLARQGTVSITPIVKPNALLIVGRPENVRTVVELTGRLDQPVAPDTQFKVFHLQHAPAMTAQTTIQDFFADRPGLGTVVHVTVDARSNALIVEASPRDMAEVAELIRRLDTTTNAAVSEVRIIQLEHSMAQDVAMILQSAIGATMGGAQGGQMPGMGGQQPGMGAQQPGMGAARPGMPGANGAGGRMQGDQRNAMLRFLTVDAKGRKLVQSGILTDVRITADVRSNTVVVSAPPENLELLETLIHQIDKLPAAEAQIKVFTIVNGDATSLSEMLRVLFSSQAAPGGAGGAGGMGGAGGQQGMLQSSVSGNEYSIISLRFAVDSRTNSIIASGMMGDLNVVEAILTRLDDSDVRHRKSVVLRLKNSPADKVGQAINEFLRSERQVQQIAPGLTSAFEQIEREVVVEPEMVTNSLILSATPRFFEEVRGIIEQLDARPPMVMIQVLIAEIDLGDTNEFGIELGLQDATLFDRSILSNIQTISTTTTPSGQPQVTSQTIVAANNSPGFNFNDTTNPLGNSGATNAIASAAAIGTQGLSNFAMGRSNGSLGYGGLVLSAASDNVSALLRALAENHRVEVLQRPQIMTLDNQPAFIQIGQRVPRITGVQVNTVGTVNTITLENVGVILGVTPRISPDGLVVMEIDAEKSALESEATGIPVTNSGGIVIRSPIIDSTTAQTTISALSDQTVVLGGLIAKTKNESHRKVPLLGDLPLLGHLFRFDSTSNAKTELLIIMTPHIVKSEADADAIRRTEAGRMSWCLADVTKIYGEAGLRQRTDGWSDAEVPVVYPDLKQMPHNGGGKGPETIPTPPATPEAIPAPPTAPMPTPAGARPATPAQGEPATDAQSAWPVRPWPQQTPAPASPPPANPDAAQPAVYRQPDGGSQPTFYR